MVLQEIKSKLDEAKHPVAKSIHQGTNFKVLGIGFKKGMVLKEHKANITSKLTVLEGSVVYKEGDKNITLERYEVVDIPVDVLHSVEAIEDSLCLLTQG
ncbi:cupin domain-containing protein [Galbibacter mesophilus]|uniref:hypothetical protein n=1 Tax=Galbibacter mesophilus TaxID=379069 RepID=UPI00191FDF00|nr:hypothetical protein [Galbibacter mesophilus]MCM5662987.1 hypothetical protein [Galbibacter mesophilus]